jgi:nucleotide-binding universal stress UspA family protein
MDAFKHLLVPTDGSVLSLHAAERAVAIAKAMNARITFFHAKPERRPSLFGGEIGGYVEPIPGDDFDQQAQERAEAHLTQLSELASVDGVACDTVIGGDGSPHEAIVRTATERNCDLIVMASEGKRDIKTLLLGNETQKVLAHAPVAVLVCR